MLGEISQTKTNTVLFHLYAGSKEQNKQKQTCRFREQTDKRGERGFGNLVKMMAQLRTNW